MTEQNPYRSPHQPDGLPTPPTQQQPTQPEKKPFYKRAWFIILAIIVVVIIIAVAISGGKEDKKDATSTPATTPVQADDRPVAQPGTETPGNELQLVLESDGALINASFLDRGNVAQEQGVSSGWTKHISADNKWDAMMSNVTGQLDGSGNVTCRILWNGEIITESTSTGDYAVVTCSPDLAKME